MLKTIIADKESGNYRKAVKQKRTYYLGIVLDTTLSFTSVYPQVYYFLERLLISLKQKREENEEFGLSYVLTLLKDEPKQVFLGESAVTDDENAVLETLSEIEFSGGSRDGEENLAGAVRFCMERLEGVSGDQSQRGLLLFSDAVVGDEKGFSDLTRTAGLRFAYLFSGDESFMPQFRFVDENGHLTENERNTCIYAGLSELLTDTEEEEVRLAEKLAEEIVWRFA